MQIGLSQAPPLDLKELRGLKFLEISPDGAIRCSHVFGELNLPRKARIIVPCVFKQHGVRELGADGYLFLGQNEIRHLSEAMARDGIGTHNLDVAVSQNIADVPDRSIVHEAIIDGRNSSCAVYPLFETRGGVCVPRPAGFPMGPGWSRGVAT